MKMIRRQVSEKEYQTLLNLNIPGMKLSTDYFYEVPVDKYPTKEPLPDVAPQIEFSKPALTQKKKKVWPKDKVRLGPTRNPKVSRMNASQSKAYVAMVNAFKTPKRKYLQRMYVVHYMEKHLGWPYVKANYYFGEMLKKGYVCAK